MRITANFHFIDAWIGETAYMKASTGANGEMEYIWTQYYNSMSTQASINVCGSEQYAEG